MSSLVSSLRYPFSIICEISPTSGQRRGSRILMSVYEVLHLPTIFHTSCQELNQAPQPVIVSRIVYYYYYYYVVISNLLHKVEKRVNSPDLVKYLFINSCSCA
jgi:hypothetical protein